MSTISGSFQAQGDASILEVSSGAVILCTTEAPGSKKCLMALDDAVSTTGESEGSDVGELEDINVHSWNTVGRRIFQSLSEIDADDDDFQVKVEPELIDVKSWGGVGSRICHRLAEFDGFESDDDFVPRTAR